MKNLLVGSAMIWFSSTSVFAQECDIAVDAVGAELAAEIQQQKVKATRLESRLAGQGFLIDELPLGLVDQVPEPPVLPLFTEGLVDADGKLTWVCDDEGNPTPSEEDYLSAIEAFTLAIEQYEVAIAARADQIAALEQQQAGASDDAVAADEGNASAEAPPSAEGSDSDSGTAGTEAVQATESEATPMPDPENPNIFRRVLSLPATQLLTEPRLDAVAQNLPTFSILYVFDESTANGQEWLQVSTSLRESTLGWIPAEKALAWSNMLVMEFAPKGKRSDVLFFESDVTLGDMVNSITYEAEARAIYQAIADEREKLSNGEITEPQWDSRLVAIEPSVGVSFETNEFLLPILDWRPELFDGITETNLLQVAALPADAEEIGTTDLDGAAEDLDDAAARDGIFRVGVVFVIDTTVSMAPFIERTYSTVQNFYDSFQQFESADFVSFGLLGFRDQVEATPGIEYSTRLFQPLDPEAPAAQVLGNLGRVQEASSPTLNFREDGLAGIIEAIEQNDWEPYDARMIVFISDASMRTGSDELAKYPDQTPETVAQLARNNNITIIPVHLLTPANQNNGDAAEAEQQYRVLSETGDINFDKYVSVNAENPSDFADQMSSFTNELARATFTVNSGQVIAGGDKLDLEEVPESAVMGSAAVNEVFRAQLESLATVVDGAAPNFLAGWTADRDLLDTDLETLEVKVFLTRNQLSSLDLQLSLLVDAFRSGGDDPQTFFDKLQSLAAQTATDPDIVFSDDRDAIRTLLPTFLQNLPYRSEVLDLDRGYWSSLSEAVRNEFMETLDAKRSSYQEVFENPDLWQDFGSNDPALQVTPLSLSMLP